MRGTQPQNRCEIGMLGLGGMRRNLVLTIADHQIPVAG
jgi:6-phosphogluconate dehydrogenase